MKRDSRAPLIIAIVLLVLPVLYVGSYLALVTPNGRVVFYVVGPNTSRGELVHYRWGDDDPSRFFWPLEQIDRKLRPSVWEVFCPPGPPSNLDFPRS
jgi:hypothetical protein